MQVYPLICSGPRGHGFKSRHSDQRVFLGTLSFFDFVIDLCCVFLLIFDAGVRPVIPQGMTGRFLLIYGLKTWNFLGNLILTCVVCGIRRSKVFSHIVQVNVQQRRCLPAARRFTAQYTEREHKGCRRKTFFGYFSSKRKVAPVLLYREAKSGLRQEGIKRKIGCIWRSGDDSRNKAIPCGENHRGLLSWSD